jgi:GAF domain-containing protein
MSFPIRPDEQQRVETLQSLNLVDTQGHLSVARFVDIAKMVFGTSMGAATLIDEEKQWFYARSGLTACETSRDVAFCNYTIYYEGVFEVTDAMLDERFRDNPLVAGPFHLRYYCGAPIILDDTPLGALCMLDSEPHAPASQMQRTILKELAAAVAREIAVSIQLRRAVAEITALMSETMFTTP